MADDLRVDVRGLRDLRSALRQVDMQRDLSRANKQVVNVIVVPEARRRAQKSFTNLAGGTTRVGSRGVASIRGAATQTRAVIRAGGARVPWFQGVDWGSTGRYRQFPKKADEGRIVYPAIAAKHDEIIREYWIVIDDLASTAFPKGKLI